MLVVNIVFLFKELNFNCIFDIVVILCKDGNLIWCMLVLFVY